MAILVHAFVTSRIDYCNGLLAGASKVVTDKLQSVMNSTARVITNTRKFDHGLSHVRHEILHWLDVPERVTSKLCLSVYKCLHGMGPPYLLGDVLADLVVAWPSSSAFCCPWRTRRSSLQIYDRWQKGIFFRGPVSMEQSPDVTE